MTYKEHLIVRKDVYLIICLWALAGAFLPAPVTIGIALLTYLLVLRTKDLSKIFTVFIAMLVFSDSRAQIFRFAETAKIGVVVMTLIFAVLNYSQFKVRKNDIFRFFVPFIAFAVLATVWASQSFTAFQKSFSYGLIFFLIPLLYFNGRDQNRMLGLELIQFITSILTAGLIIHLINPEFTSLVGRYRGLLGNPNGLGIFLTVAFAVAVPVFRNLPPQFRNNRFYWLFLAVFLVSLILSSSRSALIAIGLFFVFNRLRYLSNAYTLILFAALVWSYEYLLLSLPEVIQFFGLEEYFRLDTLEEGSGRFVAWNFAWQQVQEVFFIGGGFGHTEFVFKLFQDELSRLGHQGNAHNSYLTIWLDTGLIGIVLFATGLIPSILKAIQNSPYTLPIIYAVLFSTFFESWLSASLNPFTSLFIISLTILASPPDPEPVHDVKKD